MASTDMFQDDVKLMADTNLEAYRFSISWSRLIPGIKAYHNISITVLNNILKMFDI